LKLKILKSIGLLKYASLLNTNNPPLRKLHEQFLDHNLQSRVIIPVFLQEAQPRILPRIRHNFQFLHTPRSHI
ncbi:MAG: hypothetical protein ACYTXT_42210, partial [Nostoc sp.]